MSVYQDWGRSAPPFSYSCECLKNAIITITTNGIHNIKLKNKEEAYLYAFMAYLSEEILIDPVSGDNCGSGMNYF